MAAPADRRNDADERSAADLDGTGAPSMIASTREAQSAGEASDLAGLPSFTDAMAHRARRHDHPIPRVRASSRCALRHAGGSVVSAGLSRPVRQVTGGACP